MPADGSENTPASAPDAKRIVLKSTCNYFVVVAVLLFYVHGKHLVGWSGGAMVQGKLPVPGRPTNLDESRTRAYCACSRCGWGLIGHFFSRLSFLFSFSLSLGDGSI